MKAINFINWKYIGLTGCLVASLLTACGDDETGPEVVTPLEPKLEIVNEASPRGSRRPRQSVYSL